MSYAVNTPFSLPAQGFYTRTIATGFADRSYKALGNRDRLCRSLLQGVCQPLEAFGDGDLCFVTEITLGGGYVIPVGC